MAASDNCFSYVNEPPSPIMIFYSLPASPEYCFSPSHSQPATPWDFEDADSSFDEFEFDTSRRLNLNDLDTDFEERINMENQQEKRCQQQEIQLPEMAFADELFRNGKVLPLHSSLKLPPRLQHYNIDDGGNKITTSTSLRSPISALRSKISRSNTFDSSLDPFTVALENVRAEEDGWKTLENKPNTMMGLKAHSHPPHSGSRPNISEMPGWAYPKGLAIARKIRMVQMGFKTNTGPLAEPAEDKNDNTKEREGKKWNFPSLRIRKPSFLRRHEMKSGGMSEDKKVTEITRMTVVQYRPKFSLCLGFGPKPNE